MNQPASTQLQGISDLTVIAPITPGLIDGIFETRTYVWRLERVLKLLDAVRRKSRESDLHPSPLVDNVARLRDVQFFRFAITPRAPGPDHPPQLLMNVTFDGGWEPYMRLIWKPLGTLLDLIFCHCTDYPLAAASSFDTYIRWVRSREVAGQFFYADSGGTVADRAYLESLEALQRNQGDQPAADLRAAQTALQPVPRPMPTLAAVRSSIALLKAIYGLEPFFRKPAGGGARNDVGVLQRFAQDMLTDLRQWIAAGLFDPGQQYDYLRRSFEVEREWLMGARWRRPELRDIRPFSPDLVQSGILRSLRSARGATMRGALLLAHVVDANQALGWLARSTRDAGIGTPMIGRGDVHELGDEDISCTVALTHRGLQALGVQDRHLGQLPMEFTQGMDARAGILGDLRINHPQQWRTPDQLDHPGQVDLSTVHLVIQLRTPEGADEGGSPRTEVLPRLRNWWRANLTPAAAGLRVLAQEATWSEPPLPGEPAARNHFGYVDGISQPQLTPAASAHHWDDSVKVGELFRGWVNDRGDGPQPHLVQGDPDNQAAEWLKASTFLVIRKLQQNVRTFDEIVERGTKALLAVDARLSESQARELVRAKLMGRGSDGTALTTQPGAGKGNDFNFRGDGDGRSCPFASHVRRTNPRTLLAGDMKTPRIMRRGMSYGEPVRGDGPDMGANKATNRAANRATVAPAKGERGVFFMAYNASIAEQFEVIQRWVSGGNSTGISSSQADPFLRVPHSGETAVYTFTHRDQVVRVDLGADPVCRLMWGLYAWVPSIEMLGNLKTLTVPDLPRDDAPGPRQPPQDDTDTDADADAEGDLRAKIRFEGDPWRRGQWEAVQRKGGIEKVGRNAMVARLDLIQEVLRDDGTRYSAAGYGQRMGKTLGECPFGQDDHVADQGHAAPHVSRVKDVVAAYRTEAQAFEEAQVFVSKRLGAALQVSAVTGQAAPVDIVELGRALLAHLLSTWFDGAKPADDAAQADDTLQEYVVQPLLSVARYVFSPHPNETVSKLASAQSGPLKEHVRRWIDRAEAGTAGPHAPLTRQLLDVLKDAPHVSDDDRAAIVANVMLGMPATVLGSWTKLLITSVANRSLWKLQLAVLAQKQTPPAHAKVSGALRPALIELLAQDAVADGIWRKVQGTQRLGGMELMDGDIVWLGLAEALRDRRTRMAQPEPLKVAEEWLFGGDWTDAAQAAAPHGCPGRAMALGVLMGACAALLSAGQISATSSPTVLSLRPFESA